MTVPEGMVLPIIAGTVVSALSGYAAIGILMHVLRKGRLYVFVVYTAVIGVLGLVLLNI